MQVFKEMIGGSIEYQNAYDIYMKPSKFHNASSVITQRLDKKSSILRYALIIISIALYEIFFGFKIFTWKFFQHCISLVSDALYIFQQK